MATPSKKAAPKRDAPDALIAKILGLLDKASERFESDDAAMKQWMRDNFRNPRVAVLLHDMTLHMWRGLNVIGQAEPVNGITISKQARIPKGSVSKITRRLIAKKLVVSESLPNNKKEVHFRLTPLGTELYHAHHAFDEQMVKSFVKFLKKYKLTELELLARVLQDLSETSFF